MKRILSFNSVLILALGWGAGLAQSQRVNFSVPVSVSVSAPQSFVLVARNLTLSARPLNARGALLRGRNVSWAVSDPAKASIDSNGVLQGLAPGIETITATDTDSGITGTSVIYVYPGSVTVASSATNLQVGDTVTLTASALDADGNAIPGVPFQYFSDLNAVAVISPTGALTGKAEGRVTVTAAVDMGPAFARFSAFSRLEVTRRSSFQLKTLISSDVTASGATTLVPTRMSAAGSYVAGVTSLSNGGQALVLARNGIQTIATSGSLLNGHPITRFESVSVNNQGDIAAIADTQGEWCEQILVLFPAAAKWAPTIVDDTTRCSYSMLPGSLDKSGGLVYRYASTVYYRKPDGAVQTLLTIGDHPTGVDVVSNINNYSTTPFGEVLIETQNGGGFSVYFSWDGASLKKLFAAGDSILSNPSQWARMPMEITPGEYITRIGGSNWASISRLKGGVWSTVALNGQKGLGWIEDNYDGNSGYIFFFADSSNGSSTSLIRTDGNTNTVLGTYANWREVSQINATGDDSAVVFGTMGAQVAQVLRFSGTTSTPVFTSGLALTGISSPALAQASIPKGINPSATILRTYGDELLNVTPTAATPLLRPGDSLPVGKLVNVSALASNRLGDVAIFAQHGPKTGLFAYRNGQFQTVADTDDAIVGSATVNGFFNNADSQLAMNNQGHVAAFTYTSAGNGIYLYSSTAATAKNVMRIGAPIGVAYFSGVGQIAIDETDRVAFIANLSNGKAGLFLWDQGNIKELAETGQTDPAGRVYQGLYNVQAGGTRFVMRAYSTTNEVLMLDGNTVKVLAYDGYQTSLGTTMSNCVGAEVTMNSRGDVVLPIYTPSGAALLVKLADGTDSLVAIGSQRGPDGDWFLDIYGAGIGERGDIVFSALTWVNGHQRIALYSATPIGN